jgi:cell division protein FtsB
MGSSKPKSPNLSGDRLSEAHNHYRPSVPIYVYRQLVQELEKTKVNLQTLEIQNEALRAQNEELKAEVLQILNSAQNLRYILENNPKNQSQLKSKSHKIVVETEKGASTIWLATQSPLAEVSYPTSSFDDGILEVGDGESHPQKDALKKQEIRGLWPIILLIFLILTCFLGSFLVVNSFLKNHNSR